jgi:ABC-type sugar transport system ATPase subunit
LEAPGWLPEEPVVLGVRPEDLIPGEGALEIRVRVVEDLGADRFVFAAANAGELVYRAPEGSPPPRPGDRLRISPRPGKEHWFSQGRRLDSPGGREPASSPPPLDSHS